MAEWKKRSKKTEEVIFFPTSASHQFLNRTDAYVWDVDKTYLDTQFETFRGLVRTATEKANQKKNIPGSAKLVQCLQQSGRDRMNGQQTPIYFITASPPQMEKKILEKLQIDGVTPAGIFCKDNLPNLRPRKFWRLNKHVGYKLQALLQLRALLHPEVQLTLFGDDGESDSIIYSLFSDMCSRRLDSAELRKILSAFYVLDEQIDRLFHILEDLPKNDPVEKVYINLVDDTDPDYYLKFGRRTLPTSNSIQMAFDLAQNKKISLHHLKEIAENLMTEYFYSVEEIERGLDDLIRRQRLGEPFCKEVIPYFKENGLLSSSYVPSIKPKAVQETQGDSVIRLEGQHEPWIPEYIDYLHDYR